MLKLSQVLLVWGCISFAKTMLVLHEVYGIFKRRDKVEYSNFLTMSAFPALCTNGDMLKVIRASYFTNFPISRSYMFEQKRNKMKEMCFLFYILSSLHFLILMLPLALFFIF